MELSDRIRHLLEEKYTTDEAFSDCFTVEVELKPANKLYVFVDSDSGMNFEKCQKISRYLEQHLDTHGWLGESYVLEVSSPGIGRPLRFARQYKNNVGRTIEVATQDREKYAGTLTAADEEKIVLAYIIVEKEGKKNKKVTVNKEIPLASISKAVVKVSFKEK